MANITALNAAVDTAITNKVAPATVTPANVGNSIKATNNKLRPYEVYTAIINQAGSLVDPVMTVLENTLGATPVPGTSDDGQFMLSSTGLFPAGKTFILTQSSGFSTSPGIFLSAFRGDSNTIIIYNNDISGGYVNSIVNGMIEIRVYP